MRTMPFISAIGRSFQALFAEKDEARERQVRVDALKETIGIGDRLRAMAETEGWILLKARHEVKIKDLQAKLERAEPGDLKLIQAQIAVLREVSSIEDEMDRADAARIELTGLVEDESQ